MLSLQRIQRPPYSRFPAIKFSVSLGTLLILFLSAATFSFAEDAKTFKAEDVAFYEQKVRPLLEARCLKCHGSDLTEPKGGLRLSSRAATLEGGESGASAVPGKPAESILIQAVNYDGFEMPPRSKLPDGEIAILTKWVQLGLPWGKTDGAHVAAGKTEFPLEQRKNSHWSWKPISQPTVPKVKDTEWPDGDIDHFILSKLEDANLHAAKDAGRPALLRRIYFDLIGLPPEPAAVDSFVDNPSPTREALATVVDQLLQSKHFGERWGRHWLDLVRYAESLGHEFDFPLRHAHEYRDYVIRAFNADVPYDKFVTEHIAGDLMPKPRLHPTDGYNESLIGTGFWFMGEGKHAPVDVKGEEAGTIDNQIDVFSKTFLGLTVACARCHDHKFDAITAQDYYALAGYLQSSRRQVGQLDPGGKIAAAAEQLTTIRKQAIENIAAQKVNLTPETLDRITKAAGEKANQPEHPLYAWSKLSNVAAEKFTTACNKVKADIRLRVENYKTKAQKSELFEDFGSFENWYVTGHAFGDSPIKNFEFSGEKHTLTAGVADSGRLSNKLHGVLRSKTFEITHKQILYRLAGNKSRIRLIIDGYVMDDFSALLFTGAKADINHGEEFRWHRQAQDVSRYVGHRAHIELLDEGDGWLAVDEIRFSNGDTDPGTPVSATSTALFSSSFDSKQQLASAYAELTASNRNVHGELLNAIAVDSESAAHKAVIAARLRMQQIAVPGPKPVIAIVDGNGENEHVFIRGNHKNKGEVAPRQLLTAIVGEQSEPKKGSGRLQLAQSLLARTNPFTARVMANRLWHHLMGKGIVASTDNFGVLGQPPTHPELLDHLANRLFDNDWSIKKTIREIVLSRSYRMASDATVEAEEKDPQNFLLHKAHLKRLQGESIRDAMLVLSGQLDSTLFGPPVPVHLTSFMQGRGRPKKNGPLNGNGRRSIYTSVNRNFLPPMMLAFDTPIPFTSIGRRSVSNVPAQALILMNDPFVLEQSVNWAKRILNEAVSTQGRIQLLYKSAFARSATEDEMKQAIAFLDQQATELSVPDWTNNEKVWGDLCHVVMNVKEFIFLR